LVPAPLLIQQSRRPPPPLRARPISQTELSPPRSACRTRLWERLERQLRNAPQLMSPALASTARLANLRSKERSVTTKPPLKKRRTGATNRLFPPTRRVCCWNG